MSRGSRPTRDRPLLTPRRVALVVAAGACLVALKAITGLGPSLHVRDRLGLADEQLVVPQCTPSPKRTLTPAGPQPGPGRWRAEPPSPVERSELEAATLDGLVYLVGGQGPHGRSLSTVVAFDPRRGTYRRVPDMPARVDHALVVPHAGSLYVVGGYRDSEPVRQVLRYSPARGWTELPPLPAPRGAMSGGVIGDRLYAAGGAPSTFPRFRAPPYAAIEVYDFSTGRWSPGPAMPTPRHHSSAAVLGGALYVAGGRTPTDFSSNAFERFDPSRNRWDRLPSLPLGVGGPEAEAAAGRVVTIGGEDEMHPASGGGWVTGAVWAFDPRRERWQRLPDLGEPRHAMASAAARGRIYVFEGAPCPGFGRSRSVESLPVSAAR